jgi:LPXTG-site transpeptidase (sortase) family protein
MTQTRKILLTFGNFLMLIGIYLLLVVGGIKADEQYNVYAASGDSDIVAPAVVDPAPPIAAQSQASPAQSGAPTPDAAPRFNIPVLNNAAGDQLSNAVPTKPHEAGPSTITRIVVPAIKLDKKVIEVGWTAQKQPDGQEVAVWDVDKYRVGHHQGSSNPGDGGNVVLAGHSGGYAYPFNDIYYLKPGDLIELYSNGQVYQYTVTDHILVDEVGQPLEKRLENARYIEPTDEEVVTMVACWPLTGPNKFAQRIIIRSKPLGGPPSGDQANQESSSWTSR